MKELLEKEIAQEKLKDKPDEHYLRLLRGLLNLPAITFREWRDTGRFTPRSDYIIDNPGAVLHKDCTDVIKYAGGTIIQGLKTGGFYVKLTTEKMSSKFGVLEEAENYLWETTIKVINK